jgi:hypothetical protein
MLSDKLFSKAKLSKNFSQKSRKKLPGSPVIDIVSTKNMSRQRKN